MIFPFLHMGNVALASYIGLGVSALSSGIGGLFTNNAIKKENQRNRDWNEKMWNLTNEYNSPSNQRKLYEAAGLNPALLYNSGTSALSSYAGNLGTSENFKNPGDNINLDLARGLVLENQMKNENTMVNSQLDVNNSVINKNNADAKEALSRAEANNAQGAYLKQLTTNAQNEDIWFDLSLNTKVALLDMQTAYQAQQYKYLGELTNKVIQDKDNSVAMLELKKRAFEENTKIMWKQIDLMSKEVQGKLALWAKQGDAAERASKAAFLNSIVGYKAFELDEQKFIKFGDTQLKALQKGIESQSYLNVLRMSQIQSNYDNTYYNSLYKMSQINNTNVSTFNQMQDDYMNDFMDFTNFLIDVSAVK